MQIQKFEVLKFVLLKMLTTFNLKSLIFSAKILSISVKYLKYEK